MTDQSEIDRRRAEHDAWLEARPEWHEYKAKYAFGTPHGDYYQRRKSCTFKPGDIVTYDPFIHSHSADLESAVGCYSGGSFWRRFGYLSENEGRPLLVVGVHVASVGGRPIATMTVLDPVRSCLVTWLSDNDYRPIDEPGFVDPNQPTT